MKTIGEKIKEFRKANRLSLRDFARRAGLSHAYIAKLEKEYDPISKKKIEPTMDTVTKLAEAMNMSVESLLAETGYIEEGQDEHRQIKTWRPAITPKDEKDIAKDLERIMNDLTQADGLMFYNEPMTDEDKQLIREAIEFGLKIAKVRNKERFTPKKYRQNKK